MRLSSSPTTFSRLGSRLAALVSALALVGVLGAASPVGASADACPAYGTFQTGNWPGSCWRPYSASSPFNREVSAGSPALSGSAAMVSGLLSGGPVNDLVVGDSARDGGQPVFWSVPTDPVYRLHCVKPWGTCAIEGMQIRVPAAATPAGGFATPTFDHDAHMTIVDQASGWEYDLWNVNSKANGEIDFGWGGRTRIDGDGLGSNAVAAKYGNLAGIIREPELEAGQINHALAMDVPCTQTFVYPAAQTGHLCTDAGLPVANSVPMGAHFRLDLTDAQIAALGLPTWKRAIVTALAHYGAYVSDTTSVSDQWGFEIESDRTYTSFGQAGRFTQYAQSIGIQPEDYNRNGEQEYWFHLSTGVPWDKLQAVDVCAARGTCPVTAPATPPVTTPPVTTPPVTTPPVTTPPVAPTPAPVADTVPEAITTAPAASPEPVRVSVPTMQQHSKVRGCWRTVASLTRRAHAHPDGSSSRRSYTRTIGRLRHQCQRLAATA